MWNTIVGNRLLDRKRKKQAQLRHISALKKVKPSLDNRCPPTYSFLSTRPKARMLKKQRQSQIQESNNNLVEKMIALSISHQPKQVYVKDSLNVSYNRKVEREIDLQNQKLVERLRRVHSQYGQTELKKFKNEYERAKSNLSKSRVHSTILYDLEMPSKKTPLNAKNSELSFFYRPKSSKARPISAKF